MQEVNEIVMNDQFVSLVQSIEQDHDQHIPFKRRKLIETPIFLENLTDIGTDMRDCVYPPNCRYIERINQDCCAMIIEDQPAIRTIHSECSLEESFERIKIEGKLEEYGLTPDWLEKNPRPNQFTLGFPYIIYIVMVSKMRFAGAMKVFLRLSPMSSLSDYLYKIPLYNISDDQNVCLGDGSPTGCGPTLVDSARMALELFWTNRFNNDYNYNIQAYRTRAMVNNFFAWQYYTSKDPMFMFDVEWVENPYNMKEEIQRLIGLYANIIPAQLSFPKMMDVCITAQRKKNDPAEVFVESYAFPSCVATVGDEVSIFGQSFYISGFYAGRYRNAHKMSLDDVEGNVHYVELSATMKSQIEALITPDLYEVMLPNKQVVKNGDLLELKLPYRSFRKVRRMRQARDGRVELQLSGEIFLADVLDANVIDANSIKYKGMSFVEGQHYTVLRHYHSCPLVHCGSGTYKELDINSAGVASFIFNAENVYGDRETLQIPAMQLGTNTQLQHDAEILTPNEMLKVSYGRVSSQVYGSNSDLKMVVTPKGMGYIGYGRPWDYSEMGRKRVFTHRIKEEEIFIPGWDFPIHFAIGDHIVMEDWKNPIEMLKVRKIVDFGHSSSGAWISIISEYPGEESTKEIHYYNQRNGSVRPERVRKVEPTFGNLSAGMRLRAKVAGVPNFPKKDAFEIVAFMVDTGGVPLMLCSNLCTIWASEKELAKFEYYIPETIPYNKCELAPFEPEKIRYQPGDLYQDYSWLMVVLSRSRQLASIEVNRLISGSDGVTATNLSRMNMEARKGFLAPRVSRTDTYERCQFQACFYSLHGRCIPYPKSRIYNALDWEAQNVQSIRT